MLRAATTAGADTTPLPTLSVWEVRALLEGRASSSTGAIFAGVRPFGAFFVDFFALELGALFFLDEGDLTAAVASVFSMPLDAAVEGSGGGDGAGDGMGDGTTEGSRESGWGTGISQGSKEGDRLKFDEASKNIFGAQVGTTQVRYDRSW